MRILDRHTLHGLSLTLEALMMLVLTDIVMCVQREFLLEVLFAVSQSIIRLLMLHLQMVYILFDQVMCRRISFAIWVS